MKAVKFLFAILFITSMFLSCETDSVNDEIGIQELETVSTTNGQDAGQTEPDNNDG